jgi:hypothetical protein
MKERGEVILLMGNDENHVLFDLLKLMMPVRHSRKQCYEDSLK